MNDDLFGKFHNKYLTPIIDVINLSEEFFSEQLSFIAHSIDLTKEYFSENLRDLLTVD